MQTALGTSTTARGAIGRCRGCTNILPLRWPAENETPEDWVCTGCGERYRGIRIQNLPREFAKNARPADSASSGPIASDVDLQFESFLNPARTAAAGQQHPITIAFPDRPKIVCDLENSFSRDLDSHLGQPGSLDLPPQQSPVAANLRDLAQQPYDPTWIRRIFEHVAQSTHDVKAAFGNLKDGHPADVQIFRTIIQDQLRQIVEDKDVFACMGIQPHLGEYPSRHALQVSMLAMSIGVAMGWDAATLMDLGMGCLVHDAGMLCVDDSQYGKKGILSAHDLGEIAKHVVFGLAAFEHRTGEISERALIVAYQMHERCNGTGYPRGCTLQNIHPLARVAAMADVFVALVSPRPHRPGMVPYHAVKKLMQDTERGLFDKEAFRAFLDTVSVFPIGSFIALNDGRVGRVLRPTPGRYDKPTVEVWQQGNMANKTTIVNLAEQTDVAIASSVARLDD